MLENEYLKKLYRCYEFKLVLEICKYVNDPQKEHQSFH